MSRHTYGRVQVCHRHLLRRSHDICTGTPDPFTLACLGPQGIYPLQNTYVRKVKVLKAPKFDLIKLMDVHGDYTEEVGAKVERPAAAAPAEGEEAAAPAEA